ncbi:hypothetical protein EZS27_015688 [termite gut metagenome]|uniref:F5/8 type C domain-containing protein n=1 Tax=termite gut metagenome TaxID=433724 RepID=A0A5J4RSZ4_9ZZZZ
MQMKNIYFIMIVFAVGYFSSCKEMDSTYEEFIVLNGINYPQRADSLKIYSGFNRVKITWQKAIDPKVVRARIYWNNYTDSINVDIPSDKNIISVDIDGLTEGTYTFYVMTFDLEDNVSVPSEITATTYGEKYALGLDNRGIINALRDESEGKINWSNATTGMVYSEIRYKTNSGNTNIVRTLADESSVVCSDIKRKEYFEYRSVFLPKGGLDSIKLDWKTFETPFLYKYPKTGWTVEAKGGNHPWPEGGGGQSYLVVDNNLSTLWHSNTSFSVPHCLVIDMLESQPIFRLDIYRHPTYRYAQTIRIYLSDTKVVPDVYQTSWGAPVVEGVFIGTNVNLPLEFPSVETTGRYLIVYFPDSFSPPYMNCAEIDAYGF